MRCRQKAPEWVQARRQTEIGWSFMKIFRAVVIAVIALCIAIPGGLAVGSFEHQSVLCFDVDGFGNLYMLEHDVVTGEFFIVKADPAGRVLFREKIAEPGDGSDWYYYQLRVTPTGEIIAVGYEMTYSETDARFYGDVLSERVALYTAEGEFEASLLDIDWRTALVPSQIPFIMGIAGVQEDGVTLLCSDGGSYFEGTKLYFSAGKEPELLSQFMLPEGLEPTCISLSGTNELVITTPAGEIYNMVSEEEIYDITGIIGDRIVPMDPVAGTGDEVAILDMLSGQLFSVHLNDFTAAPMAVDTGADASFDFIEVVAVYRLSDGSLGFQTVQKESGFRLAQLKDGVITGWDTFTWGTGFTVGMGALIFAGSFGVMYLIMLGILRAMKNWGLAQKMVFGFLPGYLIIMVILSMVLSQTVTQSYEDELYAKMRIATRMVTPWIDGDSLEQTDMLLEYGSAKYNANAERMENARDELNYVIDGMQTDMMCYVYDGGRLFVTPVLYGYNYMPIENTVNAADCARYYSLMNKAVLDGEAFDIFTVRDHEGEWLVAIKPVYNSKGHPVGLVEFNLHSYYLSSVQRQSLLYILGLFGISVVLVCAYFFISLRLNLRPLKDLRWAVGQIGEGRMGARVNIKSRDEFRDIGIAFNIMSDKLEQYISNLVLLNSSYVKFVPSELFDLIGRENVTKVTLNDRASLNLSILFINFAGGSTLSQTMSPEAYFSVINKNFDRLSATVESNRGVVVRFDGTGMLALFPVGVEDALISAIQLKEILGATGQDDMRIIVSAGTALIGVAGNENRHTIATISDEVSEIYLMNNSAERMGIRNMVTEQVLKSLSGQKEYHYRFVGHYYNINRDTITGIYEFLDGEDVYSRNLKLQTRAVFEEGVRLFREGDFFEARKHFVDVLRINSGDDLASSYLVLCDRFEVTRPENWMGVLFSI